VSDGDIARRITSDFQLEPPLRAKDVREVRLDQGERWQWGVRRYGDDLAASIESRILQEANPY
jgi:hypothetical protein